MRRPGEAQRAALVAGAKSQRAFAGIAFVFSLLFLATPPRDIGAAVVSAAVGVWLWVCARRDAAAAARIGRNY